jgi:hypothetical protein
MWFNPDESGRGYFIEAQGDQVIIGTFMYDSNGQPTWYTTWATLQNGELVSGPLLSFTGGQSLNGNFKAASATPSPGNVGITLTSSSTAKLSLPDGKVLSISRAVQTNLDTSLSVKTGFIGDIETTQANAGTTGGDGGGGAGGSGGGAGAGGGLGKVLGGLMRVVDLSDGTFIGEALTDTTQGLVTVRTGTRPGPFLLTLEGRTGAKYFDEGLNQLTDFAPGQILHALVDKWDEHVGVSPLTEAAYRYALNNFKGNPADISAGKAALKESGNLVGINSAQVQAANNLIMSAINSRLTNNYQLTSAKSLPTPIDSSSTTAALKNSRYGVSAAVNGGFVKAANFYNPSIAAPGLSLASDLARDFTDGKIDGFALDGTQVAPANAVSYESVRLPIAGMIGVNFISSKFAVNSLASGDKRVDEWEWLSGVGAPSSASPGVVQCDYNRAFSEQIGLLSDGSVTIERVTYVRPNGECETGIRVATLQNFLTDVKQIVTSPYGVAYAVKRDGSVVGWGENFCGSLSPSLPYGIYYQPQVIEGLKDITSLASDDGTTLARDKTGAVFILGMDVSVSSTSPSTVIQGRTVCASDGNGTYYYRYSSIAKVTGLANVAKVFTKTGSYFALTADGKLFAWGSGEGGRLANGAVTPAGKFNGPALAFPTQIPNLSAVRDLSFRSYLQFATLADGTVKAWGYDGLGPYYVNAPKYLSTPTKLPGFDNVRELAASKDGVYLLKADGSTWAWSDKDTVLDFSTVRQVTPSSPVRHIASQSDGVELAVFFNDGRIGLSLDYKGDANGVFR